MKKIIADRRLWTTIEDEVVEDGDPRARFLLVACAGRKIPGEVAARLGIEVVDGRLTYPGAPELEGDGGAKETDEGKDPEVHKFGGARDKASTDAATVTVVDAPAPEWTQKTGPEAYLKRYPTGPNAELAKAVIAYNAGADGAS